MTSQGSASAQDQPKAAVSDTVWEYLEYRRVELILVDGTTVVGRLESVSPSTVLVVPSNGDLREIDKAAVAEARLAKLRLGGKRDDTATDDPYAELDRSQADELRPWLRDAQAGLLEDAELQGTADVLGPGEIALHALFNRSVFGIVEDVDLRAQLLGSMLGPDVAIRWRALPDPAGTLSLEASGWVGWRRSSYTIGATAMYDRPVAGGLINLSGGLRYDSLEVKLDEDFGDVSMVTAWRLPLVLGHKVARDYGGDVFQLRGLRIPVGAGYTWRPSARTAVSARGHAELKNSFSGYGYMAGLHASWSYAATERSRLSLGANVIVPGLPSRIRDGDVDDIIDDTRERNGIDPIAVLPLPYVALWWRL